MRILLFDCQQTLHIGCQDFRRLIAKVVFADDSLGVYEKQRRKDVDASVVLVHLFVQVSDRKPKSLLLDVRRTFRIRCVKFKKAVRIDGYNRKIPSSELLLQSDKMR